jgi:surface antigen
MLAAKFLAFGLGVLGLAACSADFGPKEGGGAVPGGGTEARVAGAPARTAVGAFFGSRIGAALDDDDKRRAYTAQMQALETGPSGAPVAWRNPDSGRYGNVVPGPVYQINGASCREYTLTVFIDGRPQSERGTACRSADGAWASAG